MSTELAVIDAMAWRLEQAGIGVHVREGEHALGGIVPIVHAWLPAQPDTAIALTVHGYPSEPNPELRASTWRVQARIRTGSPAVLSQLAGAVEASLTVHHQAWNNLPVARCYRYTAVPMGRDQSGRWERADNYQITINPTP